MKLEKFIVRNFRSIQRLELNIAPESSIVTFIGSISVGKSSVLRSLEMFWNEYIFDQERQNLQDRIFFSNVQQRTQNTNIEAEWHFVSTNETIEQTQFDGSIIKQFLVEKRPTKIVLRLHFDPAKDKKPARYVGWLNHKNDEQSIKENGVQNGFYWLTDDPYSEYIEQFHLDFGSHLLFRFRADFNVNVELYLKKLQEKPKEKKSLEKLVTKIFGEPITIEYIDRPNGNGSMFSKAVILKRENGNVQPFAFLSHSSKRLLAILSIINSSNNHYPESTNGKLHESIILPKILLIDSPEIGDPRAQRALAEVFIEHSYPHQIFLSTQSPRFMIGSVYLVKLHSSSTLVIPITTQEDLEQVVDILGIKPSDSLSSDAVVFVEGITDSTVFRIFLAKIEKAENLTRGPLVSFVPVDGWSKMTFTISLRILKSKYVRTHAYAIVDGDTWKQTASFHKIQNSFENVFGHKNFLRLKEECLESIFLDNPRCFARVFDQEEEVIRQKIGYLRKYGMKDKDCVRELTKEYNKGSPIYSAEVSSKLAHEFDVEEIPDRIQRLFRKILWEVHH